MTEIPIPVKLQEVLEIFEETLERDERSELLLYWAEKFKEVPDSIMKRPFQEKFRVPSCESQAFVFSQPNGKDSLNFYFAVENPQGISAKSVCALIQETVSGAPVEEILCLDPEIIFKLFGRKQLGIARSEGLRAIIKIVKKYTEDYLKLCSP